jgi:hypothetical protein
MDCNFDIVEMKKELKARLGFDLDSLWVSSLVEKKPAFFNTVDGDTVFPCTCFFAGEHRSGKTAYLSYAVKRWDNKQEAFGLVPTTEIRAFCIAANSVIGVDTINFQPDSFSQDVLSKVIQYLCVNGSYNVVFIDDLGMLLDKIYDFMDMKQLKVPEQQVFMGKVLSDISLKLGIYIIVSMNMHKSKIVDSYFGNASVVKSDSYIDLLFDWRMKPIKRRVMFGNSVGELIPESETSLSSRLEEEWFSKYGGYEKLYEFLIHFRKGPVTIRVLMNLMEKKSYKEVYGLVVMARNDGYLTMIGPKTPYFLTEKGFGVIKEETAGRICDLICSGDLKFFSHFVYEVYGIRWLCKENDKTTISKFLYISWANWLSKNGMENKGTEEIEGTEGVKNRSLVSVSP